VASLLPVMIIHRTSGARIQLGFRFVTLSSDAE